MFPFDNEEDEELKMQQALAPSPEPTMIAGSPETQPMNPMARDYIIQKYGLDKRREIEDENEKSRGSFGEVLGSGLAAFGAALQGKDGIGAADTILRRNEARRQGKLDSFDKNKMLAMQDIDTKEMLAKKEVENDPNSSVSKMYQNLAMKGGMEPGLAVTLNATKLKEMIPSITKMHDIDTGLIVQTENAKTRAQTAEDNRKLREQLAKDAADAKAAALAAKADEKKTAAEEKKKAVLTEINERESNIKDNIASLKAMIKSDGTYEAFGSHNADMERKVDQIATDMAKLTDPNSVARPSEVEMFKKGLVSPGVGMTNATALDVLNNFEKEVTARVSNAYKVRGLDNPANTQMAETKKIGGKLYEKVPGGWKLVETQVAGQ